MASACTSRTWPSARTTATTASRISSTAKSDPAADLHPPPRHRRGSKGAGAGVQVLLVLLRAPQSGGTLEIAPRAWTTRAVFLPPHHRRGRRCNWGSHRAGAGCEERGEVGARRRDAGGGVELEWRDTVEAWWPVGYGEGEQTHPRREHEPGFERTAESVVFRKPPKSPNLACGSLDNRLSKHPNKPSLYYISLARP